MHVDPPLIPLIKSKNDERWDEDSLKLNFLEIIYQQSRIFINIELPYLITVSRRSSCCSL